MKCAYLIFNRLLSARYRIYCSLSILLFIFRFCCIGLCYYNIFYFVVDNVSVFYKTFLFAFLNILDNFLNIFVIVPLHAIPFTRRNSIQNINNVITCQVSHSRDDLLVNEVGVEYGYNKKPYFKTCYTLWYTLVTLEEVVREISQRELLIMLEDFNAIIEHKMMKTILKTL